MNELTQEEIQIIVNLLQQISLPINQAPTILKIIDKLKFSLKLPEEVKPEEAKKD